MSYSTRPLKIDDKEQVESLSATVWDGRDYVPSVFEEWIQSPKDIPIGIFEKDLLVGFINLELRESKHIAWTQGLRVRDGYRDKGVGTQVTKEIVQVAKDHGIGRLRYCTSSRNQASMHVAENAGFKLINRVGYLRLSPPYPSHPKPSPAIHPIELDTERLLTLLNENPDLIPTETMPFAWEFENKNLDGLSIIGKASLIRGVIDNMGMLTCLYYAYEHVRDDEQRCAYTVYAIDRGVFVDVISRILDEAQTKDYKGLVFFLGPNSTQWMNMMDMIPEDYEGRRFLLYETIPSEH